MTQISFFGFLLGLAAVFVQTATAQTVTFGGGTESLDRRESTWISYFDQGESRFIGGFSIQYNKVAWQERYAAELDTILRGGIWRMGKHFWSTLDTNLTLTIGGEALPPGYYYLGLSRDDDEEGAFRLAVIDAAKAQAARLDAFNIAEADVRNRVPMELDRSEPGDRADELTIYFSVEPETDAAKTTPYEDGIVTDVRLTIAFGGIRLTTPVRVAPPE